MCWFCNGYWPINDMTAELTGLSKNSWLHGNALNDIRFVCIQVYENTPIAECPEKHVHEWMANKNKNYRDIIMRHVSLVNADYTSGGEDVFEKCRPYRKFDMTAQSLLVKEAEHKAVSTILLWKSVAVKT